MRVSAQEEADPREEAHVPVVFAAPNGTVSGGESRDTGRQLPSKFDHRFG
jgi:hypothetical protein